VPDRWIGLAGLIPLILGVVGLVRAIRGRAGDKRAVAGSLITVIGVTVANGADNISVYTPLFRTIGLADSLVTVAVFAIGIAIWCLAGSRLGVHRTVIAVVERWGHWLVPIVFIGIGASILTTLA